MKRVEGGPQLKKKGGGRNGVALGISHGGTFC